MVKASALVAQEFLDTFRSKFGPVICATVDDRNAFDQGREGCASHEYASTDIMMCEAMEKQLGGEFDFGNDCHDRIWCDAWETVLDHGFSNFAEISLD